MTRFAPIARVVRAARPTAAARFSTSVRAMAGETGAPRSGGAAQADAFTKREKGAEDLFIRQEERTKLLALREKLKQQRKHLDELDKHIDDLTKEQGGEHN